MTKAVAAVDLGATSGRVMLGYVGHNELRLVPVSRFPNGPVEVNAAEATELHWNVTGLFDHAVAGIAAAARQEPDIASVAIDSWAVDYGLLSGGTLLGEPFHYRDSRTARGVAEVHERVSARDLYAATGLQHLPFNTVFQLAEDAAAGRLAAADSFLLVPDLLGFWLTGVAAAERSNASTTGLFNVHSGEWDAALIERVGLPIGLFPSLIDAGTTLGPVLPSLGLPTIDVTTVGSHDTASAIVAIPATDPDFAYISCGTWSLVGVELDAPVLSDASREANFTNEGGVDGRVRYLRNVMGLWVLSETVREWEAAGDVIDLPSLLATASAVTDPVPTFDVDDERFMAPGAMTPRIAAWLAENGRSVPASKAALVRSILESLAEAYARTIIEARELSGAAVDAVHIVGGGSQNTLLCQLTANRTGLPVVAGPVEATAIGNVLIQARALGIVEGDLETLRALVARSVPLTHYTPQ